MAPTARSVGGGDQEALGQLQAEGLVEHRPQPAQRRVEVMAHQKQERPQPCADQPVRLKPLWRLRLGAVAARSAGADDQPDPGDLDRPRCQLVVIVVFFRHHLELGTAAMFADHRPTLNQLVRVGMERAPMKARPLRPVLVPALGRFGLSPWEGGRLEFCGVGLPSRLAASSATCASSAAIRACATVSASISCSRESSSYAGWPAIPHQIAGTSRVFQAVLKPERCSAS
jgi:hypothetical protein